MKNYSEYQYPNNSSMTKVRLFKQPKTSKFYSKMKNPQFFNHISILLLLICEFLHGSSSSLNPPECGRRINEIRGKRLNKIVGGNVANPEDWGWQTILKLTIPELNINEKFGCGGSLINTEWVITAAHCLILSSLSAYNVKPEELKLIFGLHNRLNPEPYSTSRKVSKIIVHPDYDGTKLKTEGLQNDIALIKLAEPVKYTDHILPICLPESNSDFSNKEAWTTGWGDPVGFGSGFESIVLRELNIPIYSDSFCKNFFASLTPSLTFNSKNSICAGESGKNICQGDSGGPLVVKVGENWQLAGINSWGDGNCQVKSVFAKTSTFMNWVRDSINEGGKEDSINEGGKEKSQMVSTCLSILFFLNSVF